MEIMASCREHGSANEVVLTAHRIKSHLQKHRIHQDRHLQVFRKDYDAWIHQILALRRAGASWDTAGALPGDSWAAFLTYAVVTGGNFDMEQRGRLIYELHSKHVDQNEDHDETESPTFRLPALGLSPQEEASSLGQLFKHLESVAASLWQQVKQSREENSFSRGSGEPEDDGSVVVSSEDDINTQDGNFRCSHGEFT